MRSQQFANLPSPFPTQAATPSPELSPLPSLELSPSPSPSPQSPSPSPESSPNLAPPMDEIQPIEPINPDKPRKPERQSDRPKNNSSGSDSSGGDRRSVRGIATGTSQQEVESILGQPDSVDDNAYWENTRSARYDVVPDQVSLGYIYDKGSDRLRQTEASFVQSVDDLTMRVTLNGMLSNRLTEEIERGLASVHDRQSNQYDFRVGSLQGVIQRNAQDRVYMAVWEQGLH